MGLDELRALLALLRENGVHSYRSGDIQLELGRAVNAQSDDEKPEPEPSLEQAKQAGLDLLMQSSGSSVRLVPKAPKVAG